MFWSVSRPNNKYRMGPDWKGAHALHLRRHGGKVESRQRQRAQVGQVLDNRDSRREQGAVDGAGRSAGVIDVR
jgi:hypothetical protein